MAEVYYRQSDILKRAEEDLPSSEMEVEWVLDHTETDPDVVRVVRCENCIHKHEMIGTAYFYCVVHNTEVHTDDFCSYGEKREG